MVNFTTGSSREPIDATELEQLLKAGTVIVDDRRRRPFYQDGRFLTAADLTRDQNYFLTRQADLGRAGGVGVVQGLMVTAATATSVRIAAGNGVTPSGELVIIPTSRVISVTDVAQIQRLNAVFGLASIPNEPNRNLSGLFVLALHPVEYTAEPIATYPTSITGQRTVNDGYIIEATAVTLIPYYPNSNSSDRGSVAREIFVSGSVRGMSAQALPLAMISLRRGVVEWVDAFMVRREIGAEHGSILSLGFAPRALREAEIQQYEQHLQDILQLRNQAGQGWIFNATEYFKALPPAGRLPAVAINSTDFTQVYFPATVDVDLAFVPSDEIAALVEESLLLPPIDLNRTSEELDSTSVLVMIPVYRQRVRELKVTLSTLSRKLLPAAPGLVAKRTPLEALQRLTLPQLQPLPILNPQVQVDQVWREALTNADLLWYVRRRNLPYRTQVVGFTVPVGIDEFISELRLKEFLARAGLQERFTNLRSVASAAAGANLVSLLSSPKFAISQTLLNAAVGELEAAKTPTEAAEKLDRVAVFKVAERFGDPKMGEGIQRLETVHPQLKDNEVIANVVADSGAVPELDRLGRVLPEAELPAFAGQLATIAQTADAQTVNRYIKRKLQEVSV